MWKMQMSKLFDCSLEAGFCFQRERTYQDVTWWCMTNLKNKTLFMLVFVLILSFSAFYATAQSDGLYLIQDTVLEVQDSLWKGQLVVKKMHSRGGYKLTLLNTKTQESESIFWEYPIFKLRLMDINHDGSIDVCMGTVKATHFDSVTRRRLFLFRRDDNNLRPLWLGSRLCHTFMDFEPFFEASAPPRITTWELNQKHEQLRGVYEWGSFGLILVRYLND